ncbi:hypothetical protein CAI16_13375 [Virgibacillus dokdonensis]|uniref:Lipoprotein n=1 Tax=Virgibacillus dokdonensis TaxID=302167 RepID=A0A3E0WLK2_9BACI|nr:hypothetical protein [Virgibacillus dokdonensis]RFA33840.1 hypothetical protein CAI16_13375 [Virgibacillus dokdonensis]
MRKKYIGVSIFLILLFLLSACGKPEEGINELSLKELKEKFDNNETFILMTHAIEDEEVKKREIKEAYDASLERAGYPGFYVSLQGMEEKEIEELGETFNNPKSSKTWDPDEDGIVLVENGSVVADAASSSLSKSKIETWVFNEWITEDGALDRDWFDGDIKGILEYTQYLDIKLTSY